MQIETLTPEQRAQALYYFFGWQGGTIHHLATATGLAVSDLLYRDHGTENSEPRMGGFSAIRTCDLPWRRDVLAPKSLGDWAFWRDAIIGFWITGPLSETRDKVAAMEVARTDPETTGEWDEIDWQEGGDGKVYHV